MFGRVGGWVDGEEVGGWEGRGCSLFDSALACGREVGGWVEEKEAV